MKTATDLYAIKNGCVCAKSDLTDDLFEHGMAAHYFPMINAFGEIVTSHESDGPTGDSWVLYRDGGRYGYLLFGWGSCSACDALDSCKSVDEIQSLMDELYASIRWMAKPEMIAFLDTHDWEGDFCSGDGLAFAEQALKALS